MIAQPRSSDAIVDRVALRTANLRTIRQGWSAASAWRPRALAILVALMALGTSAFAAAAAQTAAAGALTIYVTDRGINQKQDLRTPGAAGLHWTMSEIDPKARIAVVMPDTQKFQPTTVEDLRAQIFADLRTRVDQGRRSGQRTFEVQLVQDINQAGYFDPARQAMVDRFGAAAYGAITDLNVYLEQQNVRVTNRAVLGSNGTKVFAANLEAWTLRGRSIWDRVDMFDGRAYLTPAVAAIVRIGASRVRVFNTVGDLWAPFTPWGLRSIGNVNTARQLKDHSLPDLKVYELSPQQTGPSHVSAMLDTNRFAVQEYLGAKKGLYPLPGHFYGLDLRPGKSLPAATERRLPAKMPDGVAVWRSNALNFVGALATFSRAHHRIQGKDPPGHPEKAISDGLILSDAILKDIEESGDGPVVLLKSHTVEHLVKYAMEIASDSPLASTPRFEPHAARVGAYQEFFSGYMHTMRTGKMDADTMKSYDQGVLELVKVQLTQRNAKALRSEFKLKGLEDAVARTSQELRKAQQAAFRGGGDRNIAREQQNRIRTLRGQLERRQANLWRAQGALKTAEQRYAARLMILDTLPELAGALAEHARQGRMTVDVVDRYSDALLTLSGSLVATACAEVPVLAPLAPTLRDFVVDNGRYVRDRVARERIQQAYVALAPHKWEVLEQYQTYQSRAVHDGQPVKGITEIHGERELHSLGFSQREIDDLNAQVWGLNRNARRQPPAPLTQSGSGHLPPGPGPGGPPAPSATPSVASGMPASGRSAAVPVGGVDVQPDDVRVSGGMPQIAAVVIDPATQRIVVLREGGGSAIEGINAHTFALAIWLAYTNRNAAFSLDPYDKKDPTGRWLRAVYVPDELGGTAEGNMLFDADFLLKQYGFGVRIDGTRVVERTSSSGIKSIPQLMGEQAPGGKPQWSRLWIVVKRVELRATDGVVRVAAVEMAVRARRLVPDPSTRSGLRDVDTDEESIEIRFARQFTQLYDSLATTEAPPLAAVRELAKAIAVAQWMKQRGISVDMGQVVALLNRNRVPAVDRVSALNAIWRTETGTPFTEGGRSGVRVSTTETHLFGGVDLAVKPRIVEDRAAAALREAVTWKLASTNALTEFVVVHDGRRYQAFALPFRLDPRESGGE